MKEGWEIKKLKDVCDKITDGTHQTPKYFNEGVIFLSSRNVTSGKINWEKIKYIDEAQHIQMHKRVAPRIGDILLAKNGTTGVAAMVDRDIVFDIYVSLAHIRVLDEITPEFMLYFINSPIAKKQFNSRLKGVGVPNLHLKEIREVEIPFPKPLQEQKQIVEILDKAFEAIDQAKANIEKNIANAKELLKSYKIELFEKYATGNFVEFKSIVKLSRGQNPPKKDFIYEPKEGYIRFYQIRDGWSDNHKCYVPDTHKLHRVEEDEMLMVAYRHIGKVFRGVNGAFNVALCKISNLNTDLLNNDYLFELIPSPFIKDELLKISERSLIPSMSVKELEKFRVPLPTMDKQLEIVGLLNKINKKIKDIDDKYLTKLYSLEELKKSILQKAFSGELTQKEVVV
jgi:type I restriction enzyme S subunit